MGLLKTKRTHRILKSGGKKKITHKSNSSQLRNPERSKARVTRKTDSGNKKVRQGGDRKNLKDKRVRNTKEERKENPNKKRNKKEEEDEGLEDYEVEGLESQGDYYFPTEQFQINEDDDAILKHFNLGTDDSKKKKRKNSFMGEIIFDKIEERFEEKKEALLQESILNDPKVQAVYTDIANLLKEYKSGKLPKAFKYIHLMDQWDKVLELTKPQDWTPHAMRIANKVFSSNLDIYRAQHFFEHYLLPAIRKEIKEKKNLHIQYYMALKEAFYKPAAWFKGIVFPLCKAQNCGVKEATIIGSVLKKLSIPILHSAAALMILSDMEYSGAVCIFMKILLEKKYALHSRAINALFAHFRRFEDTQGKMPVIWHQNLLLFTQLYSSEFDEMQKEAIKILVKKKNHPLISPEILKALENKTKEDIIQGNLNKSFVNNSMMAEETFNQKSKSGGGMLLE